MQSLADNPSQGIYVGGFPRKLRERLKKRAQAARRSLTQEIIHALEQSVEADEATDPTEVR